MGLKSQNIAFSPVVLRERFSGISALKRSLGDAVAWSGWTSSKIARRGALVNHATDTVEVLCPGMDKPLILPTKNIPVNDLALCQTRNSQEVTVAIVSTDLRDNSRWQLSADSGVVQPPSYIQLNADIPCKHAMPEAKTIDYSPNGKWRVITGICREGTQEKTFVQLDRANGRNKLMRYYDGLEGYLVAISNSILGIASPHGIEFFDLGKQDAPEIPSKVTPPVTLLELSPKNGVAFVSNGKLWVGQNIQEPRAISLPADTLVTSLSFTPNGKYCFVGTDTGDILVVNVALGAVVPTDLHNTGTERGITHLAVTCNKVFAGTEQGELLEWNVTGLNA